jgi:hypothetical protein
MAFQRYLRLKWNNKDTENGLQFFSLLCSHFRKSQPSCSVVHILFLIPLPGLVQSLLRVLFHDWLYRSNLPCHCFTWLLTALTSETQPGANAIWPKNSGDSEIYTFRESKLFTWNLRCFFFFPLPQWARKLFKVCLWSPYHSSPCQGLIQVYTSELACVCAEDFWNKILASTNVVIILPVTVVSF